MGEKTFVVDGCRIEIGMKETQYTSVRYRLKWMRPLAFPFCVTNVILQCDMCNTWWTEPKKERGDLGR